MTPEEVSNYITAALSTLAVGVAIPLLILALLVFAVWRLLTRAQQDADFDIADILRDETHKVSMTQVLKLGAFCITSFVMVVVTFALPNLLFEVYATYLGFWSATAASLEFVKRKWPAKETT